MKLLQTLVPLFSLITLLVIANKAHSQSGTTSFQIDDFSQQSTELTYQGGAYVPTGSTYLRLTRTNTSGYPQTWSAGRVLYSTPVQFWDIGQQAEFETTINFEITNVDDDPADGITFFIAPVGSTIPAYATGENLGIFNSSGTSSSVFAVEFDTYINSPFDPDYRHIGIDINSRVSANVTRFDNILRQEVSARINYDPDTSVISVHATAGSQTYTLSYVFDLQSILPQQVQVGLSASTGDYVALHDVRSWYFTSTLLNVNNNQNNGKNEGVYLRQYV